ncbi:MAG: YitT family protein [Ignavibacteriae bacterium]|nr:YitT family protein [Ignavibacteriota bacterium]
MKQQLRSLFYILIGILSASFGLKGFLLPKGFLDGGAMGIALLIREVSGLNIGLLIVLVNLPFVLLGAKILSKTFIVKTVFAIAGLSLAVTFMPYSQVTDDNLLIAVFGGFFLGAGIGLSIRGGSVIDGTEVLALYFTRTSPFSIGDIIAILNIIIFSFAALLLEIEIALYAMLTYMSASRTVDFFIHGFNEYLDLTIISDRHEEIRNKIIYDLGKGVTVMKGKRGRLEPDGSEKEIDIIYTVTTKLEVSRLKSEILSIDETAFIIQNRIDEAHGGFLKKHLVQH